MNLLSAFPIKCLGGSQDFQDWGNSVEAGSSRLRLGFDPHGKPGSSPRLSPCIHFPIRTVRTAASGWEPAKTLTHALSPQSISCRTQTWEVLQDSTVLDSLLKSEKGTRLRVGGAIELSPCFVTHMWPNFSEDSFLHLLNGHHCSCPVYLRGLLWGSKEITYVWSSQTL